MSRTFRKRKKPNVFSSWEYVLYEWQYNEVTRNIDRIRLDPKSKEGIKALALFRSDAGTHKCREPGPSSYRRITRQVPLRRHGKEELRKFMLNEEYEVMITENPPLEWYT